jgi:hypothetical protein
MAEEFVSQPVHVDATVSGAGSIGEPTLNMEALKSAGKALLNKGTSPNPAPAQGQPLTGTRVQPVSPVQHQIPVTVTDGQPQPPAQALAGDPPPSGDKVTTTDANGQKVELDLHSIPDDAIVRIKRNGEIITVSGKEAKEDAMRASKFTFEMQQLRAKEAQFDERLNRATQLETLVTNDEALARYIYQTKPHIVEALAEHMGMTKAQAAQALGASAANANAQAVAQGQPAPFQITNPQELADLGQVDQLLSHRAQTLEQSILTQVQQKLGGLTNEVRSAVQEMVAEQVRGELQGLRRAHEISAIDGQIQSTVQEILTTNPALKVIPDFEETLRKEVLKMRPQSREELISAFHTVAQGIVEGLNDTYQTARKTTIIDKVTMEKTGIEPPAGTAPSFSRPITYSDPATGKVDFKLIREAAKRAIGA